MPFFLGATFFGAGFLAVMAISGHEKAQARAQAFMRYSDWGIPERKAQKPDEWTLGYRLLCVKSHQLNDIPAVNVVAP